MIFRKLPILTLMFILIFSACKEEDANFYDPLTLPDPHFIHNIKYEKDSLERPIARITCTNTSAYSNRWEWFFENNHSFKTYDLDEKVSVVYSASVDREATITLIAYADIFSDGVQIDTLSAKNIRTIKIEKQQ